MCWVASSSRCDSVYGVELLCAGTGVASTGVDGAGEAGDPRAPPGGFAGSGGGSIMVYCSVDNEPAMTKLNMWVAHLAVNELLVNYNFK